MYKCTLMSQYENLKKHMDEMDNKIRQLTLDIDKKKAKIIQLELENEKIKNELTIENQLYNEFTKNKNYLIEVKTETETNFIQIDNASTTLLEILKSKIDKI